VTLERNYRSTQAILDASNAVIGLARERFTKNLWTERIASARPRLVTVRDEADQARCVAEHVLDRREQGMTLKVAGVLFRSSSHSAQLELELARRDIPFVKYGGLKFLEGRHVKDVLAMPAVGRQPPQPDGRLSRRASCSRRRRGDCEPGSSTCSMKPRLGRCAGGVQSPAVGERTGMPFSQCSALRARDARTGPPNWRSSRVVRTAPAAPVRRRARAAAGLGAAPPDRIDLLIARALPHRNGARPAGRNERRGRVPGKDDDYLILSTIHSAKGQEWKSVQILNVVDGCIPSDMGTGTTEEIEEERRCCTSR
jgi:DNA helicase-2/ATP-dependent DNA helicase PcrA